MSIIHDGRQVRPVTPQQRLACRDHEYRLLARLHGMERACQDVDPELFFPVGNSGPALLQIDEARKVCSRCPARELCLDYAVRSGVDGIWGGTTREERTRLRREHTAHRQAATPSRGVSA